MSEGQSFFDRFPWTGAVLFFALLAAVGIFLANRIDERPHYRGEWRLVTERPGQARMTEGAAWAADRVNIQVRLHVTDAAGGSALGLAASLRRRATAEPLCAGVTTGPGGHLLLPVPARFDEDLFAGGLEVEVVQADGNRAVEAVPPPARGLCNLLVALAEHPSGQASGQVLLADGRPAAGAMIVLEHIDVDPAQPLVVVPIEATDDNGRFTVRDRVIPGRFRLTAYGDGTAARTVEALRAPAHGVELRLAATGSIEALLEFPPEGAAGTCTIAIVAPGLADDAPLLRQQIDIRPSEPKAVRLDGIPAGAYDLLIVAGPALRCRIEGVVVKPGTATSAGRALLEAR